MPQRSFCDAMAMQRKLVRSDHRVKYDQSNSAAGVENKDRVLGSDVKARGGCAHPRHKEIGKRGFDAQRLLFNDTWRRCALCTQRQLSHANFIGVHVFRVRPGVVQTLAKPSESQSLIEHERPRRRVRQCTPGLELRVVKRHNIESGALDVLNAQSAVGCGVSQQRPFGALQANGRDNSPGCHVETVQRPCAHVGIAIFVRRSGTFDIR